jgi:hypothetical protein
VLHEYQLMLDTKAFPSPQASKKVVGSIDGPVAPAQLMTRGSAEASGRMG